MLSLNADSNTPLYQQLYEQIRQKIISGEYQKGSRLVSTRKLAMNLCVGRNTVESGYDQLCAEGYVESRQGAGFTVVDLAEELLEFPGMLNEKKQSSLSQVKKDRPQETCTNHTKPSYLYQFRYGAMDHRTFPHAEWRKLTSKVLANTDPEILYTYGDKQGELVLRKEISGYLSQSRGYDVTLTRLFLAPVFRI